MCSRSPQNLEFGNFTLLFCIARQRNVTKFKMTWTAIVIAYLAYCFAALSLPSPSSLHIKVPYLAEPIYKIDQLIIKNSYHFAESIMLEIPS